MKRDVDNEVAERALFYASHMLQPDWLDECARLAPHIALANARDILTPDRLAWCIRECEHREIELHFDPLEGLSAHKMLRVKALLERAD